MLAKSKTPEIKGTSCVASLHVVTELVTVQSPMLKRASILEFVTPPVILMLLVCLLMPIVRADPEIGKVLISKGPFAKFKVVTVVSAVAENVKKVGRSLEQGINVACAVTRTVDGSWMPHVIRPPRDLGSSGKLTCAHVQ